MFRTLSTRTKLSTYAAALLGMFATISVARADIIKFQEGAFPDATYDHDVTYIRQGESNTVKDGDSLLTGYNGSGSAQRLRPIFSYDLADEIPAGLTLSDISLTLVVDGNRDATTIDIFELTPGGDVNNVFVEEQATWNVYATGNPWTTAGGDFDPLSPLSTVDTTGNTSNGSVVTFSSTPAFLNAAQAAYDAERLFQFILVARTEGTTAVMDFHGDNFATVNQRPLLTVLAVPEPASLALLGLGSLLMIGRRRRG